MMMMMLHVLRASANGSLIASNQWWPYEAVENSVKIHMAARELPPAVACPERWTFVSMPIDTWMPVPNYGHHADCSPGNVN